MKNFYRLSMAALFISGFAAAQDYHAIVAGYLGKDSKFRGVSKEMLQFRIANEDPSQSLKGIVLQIEQTYGGIPIYGATASALVKNDDVAYFTDNFVQAASKGASARSGRKDKKTLHAEILAKMGISEADITAGKSKDGAREVYFQTKDGLRYAYEYFIADKDSPDYWNVIADAATGEILLKYNMTVSCSFGDHAFSRDVAPAFVGPANKGYSAGNFVAADNASYNVYALPVEAPTFGNRSIVTNPWDNTASPDGWHKDLKNSYTYTRGNNVYAYTDLKGDNTVGAVAEGGASRNFDFPLDTGKPTSTYQDAAITNLFYMNNMMHDISYAFGFTEKGRNFQNNNFDRGGTDDDEVMAEARDGAEKATMNLNNANFAPTPEGYNPRMQMYLWNPKKALRLFYNSPDSFKTREPATQMASFGPALTATGVTGDLATTTPQDGCSTISEDLTGKIAVIARATCGFAVKVKNAQLKGAIGVIIYNPSASSSFGTMGGSDETITIPSILVDYAEGTAITTQLKSGSINATLSDDRTKQLYLDGDLDNGIIAHEYTHGISNRMTGAGYGALNSSYDNEQMGEGWSDYYALMLTLRPNDNAGIARAMGTYASGEATTGNGIRPAKYSPDTRINNYTYGKTNGMYYNDSSGKTVPDVHSIGFVWATMLWDLTWKYVEKYGYNSDVRADKNSGTARVLQLVADALKLQGNYPSFIKGRDAILAADQNATGGDNKCMIWTVFAKRGLGAKASPGLIRPASSANTDVQAALNDQVEDFQLPEGVCATAGTSEVAAKGGLSIYPNPAKDQVRFKTAADIQGKTLVTVYDAAGNLVLQDRITLGSDSISVARLQPGVYVLKAENSAGKFSQKLIVAK